MVSFPTFRRGIQAQDKVTGDRAVASLHNLLRDGTSEEKITKLRGEADTVWLAYHPDTVVCFVHRVTVIGGTRLQPEVSIWALVGDGASAYPVKWAVADVSRYREVTAAASWTNVKDVDSAEALTNAPAGQHDVQMPDLIPLPPSIACNLMDEPDRHPAALKGDRVLLEQQVPPPNFIIIYVQFYVNIKIIYESTESTIRVLRGGTNVDLGSAAAPGRRRKTSSLFLICT